MIDWSALLPGAGAGIAYALSGYAKNAGSKFNWVIFSRTVLIGLVAGLGMAVTGYDVETSMQFLISAGIVPLVENALKAIHRRILKVKEPEE